MGPRHLFLVTMLLYTGASAAVNLPRVDLNGSADVDCERHNSVFQDNAADLSKLFQRIAVGEKDRRVGANRFRPVRLKPLKKEEQLQSQKSIGMCRCLIKGSDNKEYVSESSCFIGGTRGTNLNVVANAHLVRDFFKADGNPNFEMISRCEYANKFGDSPVELLLTPGNFRIGTLNPEDAGNDRLIMKLAEPVPGAQEFPLEISGIEITEGMPLYLFSAEQERLKSPIDPRQAIAQEVEVVSTYSYPGSSTMAAFITDGSATKKASGSLYATRNSKGNLVAVGVVQSTTKPQKDGQPALQRDPKTGEVLKDKDGKPILNNVIMGLPMDSRFILDIVTVEDQSGNRMGSAPALIPTAVQGI